MSRNYIYMIEKGRSPGKKFVEKLRELERANEKRDTMPITAKESPPSYGENLLGEEKNLARRLRIDAQTLRLMASRLEAEATEIETRSTQI